jgi:hypothetical protein
MCFYTSLSAITCMIKAALLMVMVVSATGVLILNLTTTIMTNIAQASTCSGTSGTHWGSDSFSTTFTGSCSSVHVTVQPFAGHIVRSR